MGGQTFIWGPRGRHRNEGCTMKSQIGGGGGGQWGAHGVNGGHGPRSHTHTHTHTHTHSYATGQLPSSQPYIKAANHEMQ